VPEFPVDPSDVLRGLELLRSALVAPGQVGDWLPRAVDQAADVTAAINRLTDEVAKLNAHVERSLPILESVDQHVQRAMPVIESLQAEKGFLALRRSMRRAARETEPETSEASAPPQPEQPAPVRPTAAKRAPTRAKTARRPSRDN
jgi:hypothetical protein